MNPFSQGRAAVLRCADPSTGGSGFIAAHVLQTLLDEQYVSIPRASTRLKDSLKLTLATVIPL